MPLETAFPLVPVRLSANLRFSRNTTRPARRTKTPTATIGACHIRRTKRTVQRLTSINKERDARTQITIEDPVLASSPLDCLTYTFCHGAAQTTGSEAAGRIIDSMNMITRRGGMSCKGVHGARIPWSSGAPRPSARFATTPDSRIKLGLFTGAHAPTPLFLFIVRMYIFLLKLPQILEAQRKSNGGMVPQTLMP